MHMYTILHTLPGLDTVPYKVVLTLPNIENVSTFVIVFWIFVHIFDNFRYAELLEDGGYFLFQFYLQNDQQIFVECINSLRLNLLQIINIWGKFKGLKETSQQMLNECYNISVAWMHLLCNIKDIFYVLT